MRITARLLGQNEVKNKQNSHVVRVISVSACKRIKSFCSQYVTFAKFTREMQLTFRLTQDVLIQKNVDGFGFFSVEM